MATIDTSLPVHMVVNPTSGRGGRRGMLAGLRGALNAAGLEVVQQRAETGWVHPSVLGGRGDFHRPASLGEAKRFGKLNVLKLIDVEYVGHMRRHESVVV